MCKPYQQGTHPLQWAIQEPLRAQVLVGEKEGSSHALNTWLACTFHLSTRGWKHPYLLGSQGSLWHLSLFFLFSAIPLTAYGPMAAAAAAAAVVRGTGNCCLPTQWEALMAFRNLGAGLLGGWGGKATILSSSPASFASSCRLYPKPHRWFPGYYQSWPNGRALWSSQSGVGSQQLHQRSKSCPKYWLWPQPRGKW